MTEVEMPDVVEWSMSPHIGELVAALAKAQAQMEPAHLDAVNEWYSTSHKTARYATLAEIRRVVVPALSANGLALIQLPFSERPLDGPSVLGAVSMLAHLSGQWVRCKVGFRPGKKAKGEEGGVAYVDEPHAGGSAISYSRRYGAAGLTFFAAEDDDDGNAAQGHPPAKRSERETTEPARKSPPVDPATITALFDQLALTEKQRATALKKYSIRSLDACSEAEAAPLLKAVRKAVAKAATDADHKKADDSDLAGARSLLEHYRTTLHLTPEQIDGMLQDHYPGLSVEKLSAAEVTDLANKLDAEYGFPA